MKDFTSYIVTVLVTLVLSLGASYIAFIRLTAELQAKNEALTTASNVNASNTANLDERLRRIEENTAAIARELELSRRK